MRSREAKDVRILLRALYGEKVDSNPLLAARRLAHRAEELAPGTPMPTTWPPSLVALALEADRKANGWPDNYPDDWSNKDA